MAASGILLSPTTKVPPAMGLICADKLQGHVYTRTKTQVNRQKRSKFAGALESLAGLPTPPVHERLSTMTPARKNEARMKQWSGDGCPCPRIRARGDPRFPPAFAAGVMLVGSGDWVDEVRLRDPGVEDNAGGGGRAQEERTQDWGAI